MTFSLFGNTLTVPLINMVIGVVIIIILVNSAARIRRLVFGLITIVSIVHYLHLEQTVIQFLHKIFG